MFRPNDTTYKSPIDGLTFDERNLLWRGETIEYKLIESLKFTAAVTQHSVNGVRTKKSYTADFQVKLLGGKTLVIDAKKRGFWGGGLDERGFEGLQIANAVLSQITFNQRVEKLEKQFDTKGFFSYGTFQISKGGDVFNLSEKVGTFDYSEFKVSKEPFAITLVPNKSGLGNWLKRKIGRGLISIPLNWDQDCFLYMLKNYIGITFLGVTVSEKSVDREKVFHDAVLKFGAVLSAIDGNADASEIQQLKHFFGIDSAKYPEASRIFNDELQKMSPLPNLLNELKQTFADTPEILEAFLTGMCSVSLADNYLDPREVELLEQASDYLQLGSSGLTRAFLAAGFDFDRFVNARSSNRHSETNTGRVRTKMEIELEVLGLDVGADGASVKQAYRVLVKKYHPDRLRGKGMPESEIARAEALLKQINTAYDYLTSQL